MTHPNSSPYPSSGDNRMNESNDTIVVVSHQHPRLSKGGAEVAAYSLFKGLLELGKRAVFVAACPYGERRNVPELPDNEKVFFYHPDQYDHFYHLAPPDSKDQVLELLRSLNPTQIFFHHFYIIGINTIREVRRELAARVSMTFHEYLAICHHHGQMVTKPNHLLCKASSESKCAACFPEKSPDQFRIRRQYFLDTLDAIDLHVSPSNFLASRLTDWGLNPAKLAVIENGLPNAVEAEAPARRPQARQRWTFGYFGQINPFKGLDILLDAAELLTRNTSPVEIVLRLHGNIVGQTAQFIESFERTLAQNKILSYLGPYEQSDVFALMADCDYVVVPSIWWENSPVVIQEAYASRKPVITSDIGGLLEKVQANRTGLHFKRGDAQDLARIMLAACDSVLHEKFISNIPPAPSSRTMAERYLAAGSLNSERISN